MTLVYATATQYAAWPGVTSTPGNIAGILQSASLAVREATEAAFYATDTPGMPTDPTILQAFADATCCQAAALVSLGYDPLTGGTITPGVKESKQLGTARISYAVSDVQAASAAKQQAITGLVPDALRILRNAGLLKNVPWVVG